MFVFVPAANTAVSPGTHICVGDVPAELVVQSASLKLPLASSPLDDPAQRAVYIPPQVSAGTTWSKKIAD